MTGYTDSQGEGGNMAHIIIASHGGLAEGMVDSIGMVAGGAADRIETYSLHPGENPNDFYEAMRERVAHDSEQYIIMCDIKGGSVHNALFRLTEFPNVVVFAGVTLAMALEVVLTVQDRLEPDAAERVLDAARAGVTVSFGGALPTDEAEDEDF